MRLLCVKQKNIYIKIKKNKKCRNMYIENCWQYIFCIVICIKYYLWSDAMVNTIKSVQKWIPLKNILDNGIIKLKDDSYIKIIKVSFLNPQH